MVLKYVNESGNLVLLYFIFESYSNLLLVKYIFIIKNTFYFVVLFISMLTSSFVNDDPNESSEPQSR